MKLLVCEDDPIMLLVLTMMLKRLQHEVVCSKDGKEAIELINSEMPDMVITDMLLPGFSGAEIVCYLKNISGKRIPVIMLSSMPKNAVENNVSVCDADAYLLKPASIEQLKSKIEELKPIAQEKITCDVYTS